MKLMSLYTHKFLFGAFWTTSWLSFTIKVLFLGDFDSLENSCVTQKYLRMLQLYGCIQEIEEPTRVTPTSETSLHFQNQNNCESSAEFGVHKTSLAAHSATYHDLNKPKIESFVINEEL